LLPLRTGNRPTELQESNSARAQGRGGPVDDARGYDYGFITPVKKQALIGLNGARKPTPLLPPNRGMKIGH